MRKSGQALACFHDALVAVAETDSTAARILRLWQTNAALDWFGVIPPTEEERARALRELLDWEIKYAR